MIDDRDLIRIESRLDRLTEQVSELREAVSGMRVQLTHLTTESQMGIGARVSIITALLASSTAVVVALL